VSIQMPAGLTSAEVAERVARGETNAFKPRVDRTYARIVIDNVFNLFNVILLVILAVILYYRDYSNVFFASFSVIANSLIGLVQEVRAKRDMDRLAAMAAHDVRVYRDGQLVSVPIAGVVKDDVLPIEPGDRMVVDGTVLQADSLEMDESLLTGESDAVLKEVDDPICSGSFAIAGSGIMVATKVGEFSTVNQLSNVAKAYRNVQTPTQVKVSTFVRIAVAGMLLFGPMVVLAGYVRQEPFLETLRNTLVLVTSFVPQGLVLVATLSLTLGAVTISRHKTLVQRINAVESLANVNVLCFDKTGTLTCNELAVTEVIPLNGGSVDDIRPKLAAYTANLAHLNKTAAAIAQYVDGQNSQGTQKQIAATTKENEIPFTSARKWGAIVFPGETLILGAPERVLDVQQDPAMARQAQKLAADGLRVLALAQADTPPQQSKLDIPRKPLALVVMSDQVRDDCRATLDAFREQNVALKMISGDNLETVTAIGNQAGLETAHGYTGDHLESMPDSEFEEAVRKGNVFARIEPDTKRKIIATLKRQGNYVAMVGDGVNDVPALKEANLAIAMNDGAQITKDVADIVLLNNAMSTLPLAFAEGKKITQKIYATARMFLSKNIYHILLFILASFMMLPFPINPIQISWFVFGAVNIPSTLLAFGLIRPAPMRHFGRDVMTYVLVSGFVGAVSLSFLYALVYLTHNRDIHASRSAVTLFMSMFGILVYLNTHGVDLFRPETLRQNPKIVNVGIALTVLTLALPFVLPQVFTFVPPTPAIWIMLIVFFIVAATVLNVALRNQHVLGGLRSLAEA
jgi:cation-transporting P-type ATPase E